MKKISKNLIGNSENCLTSELGSKYGISRAAVYSKLKLLGIKPYKQSGRLYITSEQVQLMDDFDEHLKSGGKTREFVQQKIASGEVITVEESVETALIVQEPDQTNAIATGQNQNYSPVTVSEGAISPHSSAQGQTQHLQKQKKRPVSGTDSQKVNKVAQKCTLGTLVEEELLTLYYEATEKFTLLGLKEKLEAHRAACTEVRKKAFAKSYDVNVFLSMALEEPLKKARNNGLIS